MTFPYTFRPRAWAVLLAAAACAGFVALGEWQRGRAQERRALEERLEAARRAAPVELAAVAAPAGLALRRVAVRGELDARTTLLLEYRLHRGRPGFHVVQALRIAGSQRHVAVLRGWVEARPRRDELPVIATPRGEVSIEGIALERLVQFAEPRRPAAEGCRPGGPAPCVWLNFTVERFAAWSGLHLLPLVLEQRAGASDGLVRDWPAPQGAWRKNEMYALQWYSLAALAVVLLVVLGFRRDGAASR